jgi:uncharacterized protein (TIGR02646 family)
MRFKFDDSLYGAKEVKEALRQAQHGKCAFCESMVAHIAHGDVEHFRPKAGFVQREGGALTRPGYYWLVYEWTNLFFACQLCNQRFKKNLFPLRNPAQRALSHRDDLRKEKPLLLDPSAVDPAKYLGFREEFAYPIRNSKVGQITIAVLGLNRVELADMRRQFLRPIKRLITTRNLLADRLAADGPDSQLEAELVLLDAELQASTEDTAQFAAMVRAYLREKWPGAS